MRIDDNGMMATSIVPASESAAVAVILATVAKH
jgi:hypothetical protein